MSELIQGDDNQGGTSWTTNEIIVEPTFTLAQLQDEKRKLVEGIAVRVSNFKVRKIVNEEYPKHDGHAEYCEGCQAGQTLEILKSELLDIIKETSI